MWSLVRVSRWLLRSPRPAAGRVRPAFRVESLEDRLVPAGSVTTQGDAAVLAEQVRRLLGIDGTGVTVGVISDSFNLLGGASADAASGDLPGEGNPDGRTTPVTVLSEGVPGGRDEGRAMLQVVHDLAPGARLMFASAGVSQAQLAASIRALANAGADVIVDDVTFPAEPMFQDGVVAQAVGQVVGAGVVYFSAAGNLGRQSYQAAFRDGGVNLGTGGTGVVPGTPTFFAHDFDPSEAGTDFFQTVTLPAGTTTLSAQWADRYHSAEGDGSPGAQTDLDVALFDMAGAFKGLVGGTRNVGGDPVEVFDIDAGAGGQYQIAIGRFAGPVPALLKYVAFADGFRQDEYDTRSSTVFGHANAAGAIAVGAADYRDTPAFGGTLAARATSGAGGTPILFETDGTPRTPATRPSPRVVGPDGGNTTFFGTDDNDPDARPNFAGTSAAAPHAAAVAALMLQANRDLTPAGVSAALVSTALEIGGDGFDPVTGAGLIQALPAVLAVGGPFDVTLAGTADPDSFVVRRTSGDEVEFEENGTVVLRLPAAKLGRVTVTGGAGSDTLTLDYANGAPLSSAGLSFAGGETPGDDDRLVVMGYDTDLVVVTHDGPETGTVQVGTTGLVTFAEVEPVVLDGTATDVVVNLPTTSNPDVRVGAAATAGFTTVAGPTFEATHVRNPSRRLTVVLGDGGDALAVLAPDAAFAPAELVVVGGAGGDAVTVVGGGGDDAIGFAPSAADAGVVTRADSAGSLRVVLSRVESLAADAAGQGGRDAVSVTAPRAAVAFGGAGSGVVTVADATGAGWLALTYRNAERVAVEAAVVSLDGTAGDDAIGVAADGLVTLAAAGTVHELLVAAGRLLLNGGLGNDAFTLAADHPFAGGVGIDGSDPAVGPGNTLTVFGSGGAMLFTPGSVGSVAEAGHGTIEYARAVAAVDAGAGPLTLVVAEGAGTTLVTLTGAATAKVRIPDATVAEVAAGRLTVAAPTSSGFDRVRVVTSTLSGGDVTVAPGVVEFAGLLPLGIGSGVDVLEVAAGAGDDAVTATPGPVPVLIDGGPHAAGDRIAIVGSYPGRPASGSGTIGTVTYQNFETISVGAAPAASPDAPTTSENTAVLIPVLANDAGLADGPLILTILTPPTAGTAAVDGTNVRYTPAPGTNSSGGADTFTYQIEDANGETTVGTVTVTVLPVNDRPSAVAQTVTVPTTGAVTVALAGADGDPEVAQALTFTLLTAPLHGTITAFDPATGRLTYIPHTGYAGPDGFTFAVRDDALAGGAALTSAAATVVIQVTRTNRAPSAVPDAVTIVQGSTTHSPFGGVRANDTDPDGDTLTVSLVSGPAHGTLTLDRRGTYSYTPTPDFFGTDSFVYAVADPDGESAQATVSITVTPLPRRLIATGAGAGGGPHVKVFDGATGAELYSFFAYDPEFRGGVRVAVGDVNGDGVPDVITTPGPGGGPHVRVFSGTDLTPLASFFAFDPEFRSGANVAAGDLDGDGVAEVVTGAAPGGGSHVRSFAVAAGEATQLAGPLGSFFAFDRDFAGGVNVAVGDFDGILGDEIIAGAATIFPAVRVFRRDGVVLADFLAFDVARVGVTVAAGDIDGDGLADIVVGPGDGGGPVVRVFRGGTGALLSSVAAFEPELRGGISVGVAPARAPDGRDAVIVAPTEQARSVLVLDPTADALLDLFEAYAADFPGGVFVGAG